MKVPMSWFEDYTDMSGITPKEYAHALTMSGSMVEGIENLGEEIQNVVTGKILEIAPHQDSDHLVICQVDVGEGVIQIVTGAPNVKVGQIVPVAKHQSKLPGGVVIKKGKLRGVESNGMLCSHDELGITEAELGYTPEYGILVLPEDTEIGMDIRDYFGLNEDVVEFEITSNRPDCFSVIGLARETAVTFHRPFAVKKPTFTENNEKITDSLSVEVQNPDKCLRYTARMVKNVKIGPSPKWLSTRLKAAGVRSINNIVDITNYIMLEYGQPMHAFDLRDLDGQKIVVRDAKDGEKIQTLDEQEHILSAQDLVIADASRAVAIAGVMGGFNSEVKPDTTTIVFESATFDGASVRLTAQRAGLRTEASSRYEKGLDVNNTVPAIERACQLVEELGCGEIVGGVIDIKGNTKPQTVHQFRPEKINAFLGTDIPTETMISYLKELEFEVDEQKMTVIAPTFRPDIESEADIAEEIARIYGYDKIPTTLLSGTATTGKFSKKQMRENLAKSILTAQGLSELCTYTFTSPTIYDKLCFSADCPLRKNIVITNPLGEDTSVMRATTLASMMQILSHNYNHRAESAKLFEIGKIYIPTEPGKLPDESLMVTLGMYGGVDFYDIKGVLEELFAAMRIDGIRYVASGDHPSFHPGRTAKIMMNGQEIGIVGEVHPTVCKNFEVETACYMAEISFEALIDGTEASYTQLPRFPAVTRDIAMLVDKTVPVADLEETMVKAAGKLLENIKLFDVYEGAQIPEGKKSVAYAISFRASDRSLTGEEVNEVFDKILKKLEKECGAQLR